MGKTVTGCGCCLGGGEGACYPTGCFGSFRPSWDVVFPAVAGLDGICDVVQGTTVRVTYEGVYFFSEVFCVYTSAVLYTAGGTTTQGVALAIATDAGVGGGGFDIQTITLWDGEIFFTADENGRVSEAHGDLAYWQREQAWNCAADNTGFVQSNGILADQACGLDWPEDDVPHVEVV